MRGSFFNSLDGDRKYNAGHWAEYFSQFLTNGIYAEPAESMQVQAAGGLDVLIAAGSCFINGYAGYSDGTDKVTVEYGGSSPRIDRIVICLDMQGRRIYPAVRKGTAAASPSAPGIIRDGTFYDIGIASVYVKANATEITQADITDTRSDTSLCGWVTGVIDQIDTTALFAQYEAQWELLRAACAQDEAAVIAAWDSLNTVKKVNDVEPVNGNVSLVQGDIPSGKNAYQLPFFVQAGTVTKANPMTVTFPVAYKTAPVVVCTANLTESSGTTVSGSGYYLKTKVTKTGFTLYSSAATGYDNANWVAFGEV